AVRVATRRARTARRAGPAGGGGRGGGGAGLARSRALLRQSAERLWRRRAAWHAAHARRRGCVADLRAAAAA
ncbi:hypothetical protein, partial [Burkholderia pseudomallei]|uniref:hypothetical protein n=1 Tax=Burkholderia pseudomallei TaxID=28450 RepID=UPI001C4A8497